MNRLIIIGNGFDLAHGMKTSFKDFITDYYNNAINIFFEKDIYKDSLLELEFKHTNGFWANRLKVNLDETFEAFEKIKGNRNIKTTTLSVLLRNIKSKMNSSNWVDVELEYFNLLKSTTNSARREVRVNDLNIQFDFLKKKLVEYLQRQEEKHSKKTFNFAPFIDCFTQDILAEDLVSLNNNILPDSLYFLNFNYTNTLLPYFGKCGKIYNSELNHIHGSLDNTCGEPIFGFGDEFDKNYLLFEDLIDNDYYRHIKSFEYSKTRNYFNLLSFLESNPFQVHIYGHSCGLSDRTMLNSIFESKNCRSIKIFYHRKNRTEDDFTEKTFDIYRHFKDKGEMRRKIVPYNFSDPMPQPVKELVES